MRNILLVAACSVSAFDAGVASAYGSEKNNDIDKLPTGHSNYSTVPTSFRAFMQGNTLEFSLIVNGITFKQTPAMIANNKVYVHISQLDKLNLSAEEESKITSVLRHGLFLNSHPDVTNGLIKQYYIDFSKMTINVTLGKHALSRSKRSPYFLGDSSVKQLSSIFQYDANLAGYTQHDNSDDGNENSYNLYLKNITGFKNNSVHTGLNAYRTDKKTTTQLDHLFYQHDFTQSNVRFGYVQNTFNNQTDALAYSFAGSALLASWSSSDNRVMKKGVQSLTPVTVFLSAPSSVRVYKSGQLVYSRFLPMGAHTLDTSDFPGGNYQVRIDIYQQGRLIRSMTASVNKPFTGLNSLMEMPGHYQYSLWSGLVDPDNGYSFNEAVNGFSIGTLLGHANALKAGTYVETGRYNLLVSQATDYFYTSIGLFWGTVGLDTHHGFARDIGYQAQITGNLSAHISYNDDDAKSVISPFYSQRSLDTGIAYDDNFWGSFNVNYNRSLRDGTRTVNLTYSKQLYQFGGTSVNLTISRNNYRSIQHQNSNVVDNSIMLQFSYSFDSGSMLSFTSGYSHNSNDGSSSSFDAQWTPAQTQHTLLSNVSASWSHRSNSDTLTLNDGFNTSAVTGSVGVSKTFATGHNSGVGYSADLSGSFVMSDALSHATFAADNTALSGVMVRADIPENDTVTAVLDGASHELHRGNNFISATPYAKHSLYIRQSGASDSTDVLHLSDVNKNFTLYQGNVQYVQVNGWRTQVEIGQLMQQGHPMRNTMIKSGVASTETDEKGFFMLTSKMGQKELQAVMKNGRICLVQLSSTSNDKPSQWVGKVNCMPQKSHTTHLASSAASLNKG